MNTGLGDSEYKLSQRKDLLKKAASHLSDHCIDSVFIMLK